MPRGQQEMFCNARNFSGRGPEMFWYDGDRNVLVEQEIFWLETGNVPVVADDVQWGAGNDLKGDSKYSSRMKKYSVEDRKSV